MVAEDQPAVRSVLMVVKLIREHMILVNLLRRQPQLVKPEQEKLIRVAAELLMIHINVRGQETTVNYIPMLAEGCLLLVLMEPMRRDNLKANVALLPDKYVPMDLAQFPALLPILLAMELA